MKLITALLLLTLLIACGNNNDETKLSYADFDQLSIMDAFEDMGHNDNVQDTVYYQFNKNQTMQKIRLNYIEEDGVITLAGKDIIKCIYYLKNNSIFMTLHDDEMGKILPSFGKDYAEWKVLELNADTLIVDAYTHGDKRLKVGHWGFSVE